MKKPNFEEARERTSNKIIYEYLDDNIVRIVSNKKFFIRTYGCQMNTHDSEQMKFYLTELGYTETDVLEDADVVILNTCAVRENAKEKLFGFLSRAKHLKSTTKPDLIIVLSGCLMQTENEVDFVDNKHKYVDIVIGTHNIDELPKLIKERDNKQSIEVYSNSDLVKENIHYNRDSKLIASVNITYGCNNFCTYCVVPFTRGKERSRKKEDILDEINNLIKDGYKEVILLGQNVNSYGYDFDYDYKFYNLLEEVAKTNIERIRFVTSNPWNFTDELIDVIGRYNNIIPAIHLPVQSGSNNVLKRMNRKYTRESYIELFDKIKEKISGVSITTDIIVGFPNESDKDFEDTLNLVDYCKFDGAFTFIYSKREGTLAANYPDVITREVKEERLQRLNTLVNKYSLENNLKYQDKVLEVLIEGVSDKHVGKVYGHSREQKTVNIEGSKDLVGKILKVKIIKATTYSLDGIVIDE